MLLPLPGRRPGERASLAGWRLAELTMGLVAEATVPDSHRWIPKGMCVEYTAKARGTMSAEATLELPGHLPVPGEGGVEAPVALSIRDEGGREVLSGEIRIWITPSGRD